MFRSPLQPMWDLTVTLTYISSHGADEVVELSLKIVEGLIVPSS